MYSSVHVFAIILGETELSQACCVWSFEWHVIISVKFEKKVFHTYTEPQKETLQSSLLYYLIKCDNLAFLHSVKVVRDVFEDKCQIWTRLSEAKLLLVDLNGLHDLHGISTSG